MTWGALAAVAAIPSGRLLAAEGAGEQRRSDGSAGAVPRIGFNSYSIRNQLGENSSAALKRMAAIGFTESELIYKHDEDSSIRQCLDLGMRPVGLHFWHLLGEQEFDAWVAHGMGTEMPGFDLDQISSTAKRFGFEYVVYAGDATIKACTSIETARQFCTALDHAGRELQARGFRLLVHPEPPLFSPIGNTSLYDLLIETVEPSVVGIELDVFWAAHVGRDPVSEIQRLGTRMVAIHLKDRRKGIPISKPMDPYENKPYLFVPVGTGSLNFPAILAAARLSSPRHYIIEHDDSVGDPFEELSRSFQFVERHLSASA